MAKYKVKCAANAKYILDLEDNTKKKCKTPYNQIKGCKAFYLTKYWHNNVLDILGHK